MRTLLPFFFGFSVMSPLKLMFTLYLVLVARIPQLSDLKVSNS